MLLPRPFAGQQEICKDKRTKDTKYHQGRRSLISLVRLRVLGGFKFLLRRFDIRTGLLDAAFGELSFYFRLLSGQ